MPILRRIWARRPVFLYAFVVLVVLFIFLGLYTDRKVSAYEAALDRDPQTGIMRGAEPRALGPENSRGAVLFVHGFMGSPNNYNDLPDAVAQHGWRAEAILLPGHGTSPREFERTTADEMLGAVVEKLRALKAKYEDVILVGHSMGGAIATLAAAHEPVDKLILAAPYFGLTNDDGAWIPTTTIAPVLGILFRWAPGMIDGGPVNKKNTADQIVSYRWYPAHAALEALELCARANDQAILDAITCPVLLIHSENDTVTSAKAAKAAVEKMKASDIEYRWLSKSDHIIFWDYEAEEVKEAVLEFLSTLPPHLGTTAPAPPPHPTS